MKTKITILLLAIILLTSAAWYIQHDNGVRDNPGELSRVVNLDEKDSPEDPVPEPYRETIAKALAYLARQQHKDGHWEGDDGQHPVAMTGLVGLALLMERSTPVAPRSQRVLKETEHSPNVRKAADWLMGKSNAERDGLIFSENASELSHYMEGHGLATLFLAGAIATESEQTRHANLSDVLMKAVKYIVRSQSSQGGWYHTSRLEGHDFDAILPTVIQLQALKAAENAGIPVPSATTSDARAYLKLKIGQHEATGVASRARTLDTAAAIACVHESRIETWAVPPRTEPIEQWLKYCRATIPVGKDINFERDELMHYYYAQALYLSGGDAWTNYRAAVFDHLKKTQRQDGSFPACKGISVGPVYATAMWCTILLLDRNSHPAREVFLGMSL